MIKIKCILNGILVIDESGNTTCFKDDLEEVVSALYHIASELGFTGSRYDEKRIKISLEPGDKYGDG